jgi:6-phospho-3-hexuloisomerase
MKYQEYAQTVVKELQAALSGIDGQDAEKVTALIEQADEVFCAGAGRSGFAIRGFAMRLMHMGAHSYVVGETTTPNIRPSDLLVICSGSGETRSLVGYATKAHEIGAKIVLITINPNSTIANLADQIVVINAVSPKSAVQGAIKSIQPMGSLFEQTEGLFLDIIIMMLMEKKGMTSETMFGRHANLE